MSHEIHQSPKVRPSAEFDDRARPPEILFPPRRCRTLGREGRRPTRRVRSCLQDAGEGELRWYVDGAPVVAWMMAACPAGSRVQAGFYRVSAVDPVGRASIGRGPRSGRLNWVR